MEITQYVSYDSQKPVSLFTSAMKRVQTSSFMNNDCVWYVFISCIVVMIVLTCYRRLQIGCVFNKDFLSMYLQQEVC